MLEKTCFNLQLVDDLKAGDLFSDKRFKDIVISRSDKCWKHRDNILEKNSLNPQLVDDLKAGDLFSDKRFKDIVISMWGTFISAFSNIMP